MTYYHDIITEQSWQELQKLRRATNFILIGGWATYLYTHALKSKDIDIIVGFKDLPILDRLYALSKNDRLKKYEAVKGLVQIDLYLPHYSEIGIPVEILQKHAHARDGFTVLHPDWLLALKLFVLSKRGRTLKGMKDFLDILALLHAEAGDLSAARRILRQHGRGSTLSTFATLLAEHRNIPELGIGNHAYARLKRAIKATEANEADEANPSFPS